jgi:hypothetical protein
MDRVFMEKFSLGMRSASWKIAEDSRRIGFVVSHPIDV